MQGYSEGGGQDSQRKALNSIIAIILIMIIERPQEVKRLAEAKKWMLIYGRRKTGKTFLVERFLKYDEYFFVKRDRSILSKKDESSMPYDAFMGLLKRLLADGKTVVVDEFHRMGDAFFDFIHYTGKSGKLVLLSSTLFLSKKLFSAHSPLLGFFAELPVGLITLEDSLRALKGHVPDKKQLVELSILLREPIAVEYFGGRESARKTFAKILVGSMRTVPALIGEVFVEEERSVSAIYEGIIRAIASGKAVSSEISSHLFSAKLIKKDDPSIIQQYLSNLADFGVIRKIEVYGKNRFIYKIGSPLVRLFYYADEKYNVSERNIDEAEAERIIDEIMPKIVEDNIRELLAGMFGLKEAVMEAADYDVDGCLLRFGRPEIVLEVKWKAKVSKEDVLKAEQNLAGIPAKKKLLFVPDKKGLRSRIVEITDIRDYM